MALRWQTKSWWNLLLLTGTFFLSSIVFRAVEAQDGGFGGLFAEAGSVESVDPTVVKDGAISGSATYQLAPVGKEGVVTVKVTIGALWHIYSTTQPQEVIGAPPATKFVTADEGIKLGTPKPDRQPNKSQSAEFEGLNLEEFGDKVVWTIPVTLPERDEKGFKIKVSGAACNMDGCRPFRFTLPVLFAGVDPKMNSASGFKPEANSGTIKYRHETSVVTWEVSASTAAVTPGGMVDLQFVATPDATYHIYQSAIDDSPFSTNFVLTQRGGLEALAPKPDREPVSSHDDHEAPGFDAGGLGGFPLGDDLSFDAGSSAEASEESAGPETFYYSKPIRWVVRLKVPEDAKPGKRSLAGWIGYQACTNTSCLQPLALGFKANVEVFSKEDGIPDSMLDKPAAMEVFDARYPDVIALAKTTKWVGPDMVEAQPDASESTEATEAEPAAAVAIGVQSPNAGELGFLLGFGFLGGLILNIMPCVLPVLGLKVMSVLDSVGKSRRELLTTNLAYTLGVLAVFWAIAVSMSVFQMGWGEQFKSFEFKYILMLLVFAFALSFFGVWELPAPGFASGKGAQDLQKSEGTTGSFFKGLFTTVLATPCGAPLLAIVLASLPGNPTWVYFAVMTMMGLGMALPYLLLALFPNAAHLLPKPGNWMETFKQALGFGLLLTAAFFLFALDTKFHFPAFVSMVGVWFACWLIGKVPSWKPMGQRVIAWGSGIAVAVVVSYGGFAFADMFGHVPVADGTQASDEHSDELIHWVAFSNQSLEKYRSEGRVVMVDFTAKWCANCHWNFAVALNTKKTAEQLDALQAVAMLAQWEDSNPNVDEVTAMLNRLQSKQIPVLAIYPADASRDPIVLHGVVSQDQVLKALERAGAGASDGEEALAGFRAKVQQELGSL